MSLQEYRRKRNFKKTAEPRGLKAPSNAKSIFVIQKHQASHLHYDFRLELGGVLKSWAIPKGPSVNPGDKRLAVEVEDHPLSYAHFEGRIPADEYGGGSVIVWDTGDWVQPKNAMADYKKGRLEFELRGHKLQGKWILVRTRLGGGSAESKKANWLLIKRPDEAADDDRDVLIEDRSVISDRTVEEVELAATLKPRKAKLFRFEEPQLATLVSEAPEGGNWIHEIKFDGYRTVARKERGRIKMLTRTGLDWSRKFPEIAKACAKIKADSFVIDGEIAWVDDEGHTQFEGLQNALSEGKTADLVYYVFDLLYFDGYDLRDLPLVARKKRLESIVERIGSKRLIYSTHWNESGAAVAKSACEHRLEGIVSKDGEGRWESGRSRTWLKTKCRHVQEFVIGGYTLQDNRTLGALLVGGYKNGELHYAGKVGTGFNGQAERILMPQIKKAAADISPFIEKNKSRDQIHWLKPQVIANVEFSNFTSAGILRHAAFKGVRDDKKAKDVMLIDGELQPTKKSSVSKV